MTAGSHDLGTPSTNIVPLSVGVTVILWPSILLFSFAWSKRKHSLFSKRGLAPFISALFLLLNPFCGLILTGILDSPCILVAAFFFAANTFPTCIFLERTLSVYVNCLLMDKMKDLARENFGYEIAGSNRNSQAPIFKDSLVRLLLRYSEFFRAKKSSQYGSQQHSEVNLSKSLIFSLLVSTFVVFVDTGIFLAFAIPTGNVATTAYSIGCERCITNGVKFTVVLIAFLSVFRLFVASRLRSYEENLHLSREFRLQSSLTILFLPIVLWCTFFTESAFEIFGTAFMSVCWFVVVPLSCPIIMSGTLGLVSTLIILENRQRKKLSTSFSSSSLHSVNQLEGNSKQDRSIGTHILARLLKNHDFCVLYESFLCREFSLENLLAYRAAERYFEELKDETKIRTAQKIFDDFCDDKALMAVNISAEHREDLRKLLVEIKSEGNESENGADMASLDFAVQTIQEDVFQLMWMDSFRRFKRTKEFEKFKAYSNSEPTTAINVQAVAVSS
jgi:hypothetical protein